MRNRLRPALEEYAVNFQFLLSYRDPPSVPSRTRMYELLADDARRTRLGAAGREHVRAHHDVAEQGRAHAELYARLASR